MVGAALLASNISTFTEYLEIFVVSFFTPRASDEVLQSLTLRKPLSFITDGKIESRKDPRLFAGFLLIVMIVLYIIFR